MEDTDITVIKRRLGINGKQLALICHWLAKTMAPDTQLGPEDRLVWQRVFVAMDPETQAGLVQDHKDRMEVNRKRDREIFMPNWMRRS